MALRPEILDLSDLRADSAEWLVPNNHPIKFLTRKHSKVARAFREAMTITVRVSLVWAVVLLGCVNRFWSVAVACWLLGFLVIFVWADSVQVLLRSAVYGRWHMHTCGKALVFWGFWPFWITLLCATAFALAFALGESLWLSSFETYYQLAQLKGYTNVDPKYASGQQLMDAGVVEFANYVGIDRMHGGCFHTKGKNFCVAPILHGGKIVDGLGDAPHGGSYDFFAVGVDCCNCPNQDFKCGAWNDPIAQGGLRSMDFRNRPYYRLAVDDWSAAYRKTVNHPLFFEWVSDADYAWRKPWYWAFHLIVIAICVPFPVTFLLGLLLSLLCSYLVREGFSSPLQTPGPPVGFEKKWERALPEMRDHFLEEQRQMLNPQWYGMLGPRVGPPAPPTIGPLIPGTGAGAA